MTIQSGFFNSINGDRKYSASNFAEYFASFIGNGVFPTPSTNLQVVESENMNIIIKAGKGWINGYFVVNDSDYTLTLDNADGVLKRIDRVVMRLNYLTRQIEIAVKKGTFASNPVAPTLQRDTDMYELTLADILINNGATTITQVNITDTRFNNSLCGIVKGLVDQIDTTNLFAQYDEAFENWFDSVQSVLDGDVAGNLYNLITELEEKTVTTTTANLTLYVDSVNGNDTNDGLSNSTAYKTIQKAIDSLPLMLNHSVVINVANGYYDENVVFNNKVFSLGINLRGNTNTKIRTMNIGNSKGIILSDLTFENKTGIVIQNSDVNLLRLKFIGEQTYKQNGIWVLNKSKVIVKDLEANFCSYIIQAVGFSEVAILSGNYSGDGNTVVLEAKEYSIIYKPTSFNITATTAEKTSDGGRILT